MEITLSDAPVLPGLTRRLPPGQRVVPQGRRYLVFGGAARSRLGGWKDYVASFSSLDIAIEEAITMVRGAPGAWAHVVDLQAVGGPAVVAERTGRAPEAAP